MFINQIHVKDIKDKYILLSWVWIPLHDTEFYYGFAYLGMCLMIFTVGLSSLFISRNTHKAFRTNCDSCSFRAKVFEDIDRFINPDQIIDRVVFDLDAIVASAGPTYTYHHSKLGNSDEIK